jgi:hypothetical protein
MTEREKAHKELADALAGRADAMLSGTFRDILTKRKNRDRLAGQAMEQASNWAAINGAYRRDKFLACINRLAPVMLDALCIARGIE